MLIHAGRGIPALGQDTVRLSGEFPDAQLILAHCAISDLAWLWRELPATRTCSSTPRGGARRHLAMFALCPPGNIVWASDSPYGLPLVGATQTLRLALQAGLSSEQLRGVMGAQVEHVLDGEDPLDLGAAPGPTPRALDPLLDRVVTHLTATMGRAFVARRLLRAAGARAAGVRGRRRQPRRAVCSAVLELLDHFDEHVAPPEDGRPIPAAARLLVFALIVARTPDVPLPDLPGAPHATRAEAEAHEPQGGPGAS